MGWITRLLRKENPANRATFAMYSPGQAIWTGRNYAALAEAGYQNCATAYACAKYIGQNASRMEWLLTDRRDNEIYDHPLLTLLHRPNEHESGLTFTEKAFIFLMLAGNTYVNKVHGRDSAPPKFLYVLRPDRMKAIAGTWQEPIAAWEYSNAGQTVLFKTADILHMLEFHPTNDVYGLSRIEVAARLIDISNQAQEWNKKLLQNDMRPAGMVRFKEPLTDEERDEFRKQIEQRLSGSDNAGKFLITEGDTEWTQMSMNAKDIDWLNGQKFTMRQICSIFGVPSQLLGDTEASTYANYQEARKAFYEETVLPLMDIWTAELNSWLVPLFGDGLVLDYDRDSIEALQEDRSKKWASLSLADWLTINEKREATGFDEITEGDVLLVPISSVPLEDATGGGDGSGGEGGTPQGDDSTAAEDDAADGSVAVSDDEVRKRRNAPQAKRRVIKAIRKSFWTANDRRAKLWTQFDQRARKRAKTFEARAVRYLQNQADEIRDRVLTTVTSVSSANAALLFDVKEETKRYAKEFNAWYRDHAVRAGNAGLKATKGELLDDTEWKAGKKPQTWTFDLKPAQEEKLQQMIFNSGTKVNETTIDTIYTAIRKAQEENATVEHLAQNIWEQVDEFAPSRARLWAETEATKVDNWGMLEGFKENEAVDHKGWNCQMLDTSREDHIDADGQERALDEPFDVGGEELDFPGDPAGSPGNVCNCRCSQYPVIGGE